ncbi:MAG: DUF3226 domain-containing protein [Alphaproteobacteria bacterium]
MEKQFKFTTPKVILCEGSEDKAFLHRLIIDRGLGRFHVMDTAIQRNSFGGRRGGNTKFGTRLDSFRYIENYNIVRDILIITDKDDDPDRSFSNLRTSLDKVKIAAPARPMEPSDGLPRITIAMIPIENDVGCLETMLIDALRESNRNLAAHVDQFRALVCARNWLPLYQDKLWTQSMISASVPKDPFISLRAFIQDPKMHPFLPIGHPIFNSLARIITTFAR